MRLWGATGRSRGLGAWKFKAQPGRSRAQDTVAPPQRRLCQMAVPPAAGLWASLGPLRISLGTEEAVRAARGDGDCPEAASSEGLLRHPEETGASGRRTH